jgi:hypothetical protein
VKHGDDLIFSVISRAANFSVVPLLALTLLMSATNYN